MSISPLCIFSKSYVKAAFILLLSAFVLTGCFGERKEAITLVTPEGEQHGFQVAIADTKETQQKGLMFVEAMPEDEGMIFLFKKPEPRKFWMKNTLIPLDMLFFDASNTLVYIEAMAEPETLTSRGPETPICTVVEINGGLAEKMNIMPGTVLKTDLEQKCLHNTTEE